MNVFTSCPVRVVDFACPLVNRKIAINGDGWFGVLHFWPVCQDLGVSAIAFFAVFRETNTFFLNLCCKTKRNTINRCRMMVGNGVASIEAIFERLAFS